MKVRYQGLDIPGKFYIISYFEASCDFTSLYVFSFYLKINESLNNNFTKDVFLFNATSPLSRFSRKIKLSLSHSISKHLYYLS